MNEAARRHRRSTSPTSRSAPNFKRRLSGVTSTIVQLVPIQARTLAHRDARAGLPAGLPGSAGGKASACCGRPRRRPFRIWHARRNIEMIAGILLRDVAPGAAEAGLHLGRPARSPAAHQMADPAHGCGDRHQSALGQFPRGSAHRDHARRRSRQIPSGASRRGRFFRRPACRAGAPSAVSAASATRRAPTSSSTR